MTPPEYHKRIADQQLESKLQAKGAVLVEGAKWCGKTTTAEQHAASILPISDPRHVNEIMATADVNLPVLLEGGDSQTF